MGRLKKYEFTGETRKIDDYNRTILKRIRAVRDFGKVKSGEIGGWIESGKNLSQEGEAWVAEEAWVSGDAVVEENAYVSGKAWISEEALVKGSAVVDKKAHVSGKAWVSGEAHVFGEAHVSGEACIYGEARVSGETCISEGAYVYGGARVSGEAHVSGEACVSGEAQIRGKAEVTDRNSHLCIGPIGSRYNCYATFYRDREKGIAVKCGCFEGSLEEFQEKVKETHGNDKHAAAYRMAAELAKLRISVAGTEKLPALDGEEDTECLQKK